MAENDGIEDFNSSDIEFEPAPRNPFAEAGKASIEAIISNAVEDRLTSKKTSKQLTNVHGCKKTQYIDTLWYQRFTTFRQHTLKAKYVCLLSFPPQTVLLDAKSFSGNGFTLNWSCLPLIVPFPSVSNLFFHEQSADTVLV